MLLPKRHQTKHLGFVPAEMLTEFMAGGIFGLLMWWMGARMRPSVDELNGMFQRLALPVLKAALASAQQIEQSHK